MSPEPPPEKVRPDQRPICSQPKIAGFHRSCFREFTTFRLPATGEVLKFFRPFGKWHFLTKGCDFSFAAWFFPFARPFEGLPYFMGCMKLHHQSLQIHAGTARNPTNSRHVYLQIHEVNPRNQANSMIFRTCRSYSTPSNQRRKSKTPS